LESNWRYNVVDLFGPGTGFELCARLVDGGPLNGWLLVKQNQFQGALYLPPVPGQLPVFVQGFTITPGIGHFPYNFVVEPD
jgi:hypothetical protein